MKVVKNIMLWVLSVFLLLMAIGLFTERFLSGFLMLLAALVCNPLVLGLIAKRGKRLKKRISIPCVIILFMASLATMPASSGVETGADPIEIEPELTETEAAEAEEITEQTLTAVGGTAKATNTADDAEVPEKSNPEKTGSESKRDKDTPEESELTVHFLDIGQGDAALIACDGEYMLIDAGDNDKGTAVQNYLMKQGVTKLKYVIGTHPDADHIGGLDVILYKFECETVMMPDIVNDTATYRDVIDTMDAKGYRNTLPQVGDSYTLGSAEFTILGPQKTYGDTNNSSIVLRLTHGNNSFLFMGDAEEEAEADILKGDNMVDADVIKVGHHGSRTASSKVFLQAVSPLCAVISCAEDNSYGHPHAETLNNLRAMGVQVFRTDEQGTVVVTSDGQELKWNCAPSETWKAGESTQSAGTKGETKTDAKQIVQQQSTEQDNTTEAVQNSTPNSIVTDSAVAAGSGTGQTAGSNDTELQQEEPQKEEPQKEQKEQITAAGTGTGGSFETGEAPAGANYIGNKRNGKLHRASCHTLPKEENQAVFSTREEAVAAGYDDPCGNCHP